MTLPDLLQQPRSTNKLVAIVAVALLVAAGFLGLGIFQIQRLAWKEALMARVRQHVQASPVAAPASAVWPTLNRASDEYRRLVVRGRFAHDQETLVRASTVLGAGYWVITPLHTDQGYWLLVNRGFVTPEQREPSQRIPSTRSDDQPVMGLLRMSEPGGTWLQSNDASQDRWYSRDVAAIAAARGLTDAPVAPYFVDTAATEAASAWPRPGLTVLHFNNNHLVYALTWFTLAAMTACGLGYLLADERRLRRLARESQRHDEHAKP